MSDALSASPVRISGHGGDEIEAYLARPDGDGSRGGVVVIHHLPGYDRATKEITRRFAELGYDAICPNLHYREAPGATPDHTRLRSALAARAVEHRALGIDNAAELVNLFEEARFSPHVMNEAHRESALRVLQLVLAELRSPV